MKKKRENIYLLKNETIFFSDVMTARYRVVARTLMLLTDPHFFPRANKRNQSDEPTDEHQMYINISRQKKKNNRRNRIDICSIDKAFSLEFLAYLLRFSSFYVNKKREMTE